MIDFRLKVFCSVAHNLSFTKASKELYVSQPAISKHIQELETEYSTRLFERMGTHITLTPDGELLLSHAEKILKQYKQLDFEMNLLTQRHIGELRLGASTTIASALSGYISTEIQTNKTLVNQREFQRYRKSSRRTSYRLGTHRGLQPANTSTLHPFYARRTGLYNQYAQPIGQT